MIGPKLSSRITAIVWSTSASTVGSNQLPARCDALAAGERASRPWPRASATCASSTVELRRARDRRRCRCLRSSGSPRLEALHRRDERVDEGVVDPLVHVDALDRAAALAGVVHRAVGERLGGGLRVGVVADVGRVLAAELELQLDHARAQRLRRCFAPVAYEPVKKTPSTRCSSSAAPTSPRADDGDEHVGRARRPRAAGGRCAAPSASRTPTACRAPRCRSAAPARTRCRRRTRDSSRPRCWRRRRAARGRCCSVMPPSSNTVSSRRRGLDLGEEEVDARPSKPFSSLRDCAIGLPTSASASSPACRARSRRRARKRAIAIARLASGVAAQAGCAARARAPWRRRWPRRRQALRRAARRSAGLAIVKVLHAVRAVRAARGRGEEVGEQRRVVERAFAAAMELGMPLHGRHVAAAGPADRLDHAVGRAARLDDEAGREVLDRLVVDAVDDAARRRLRTARPGACRSTNSTPWKLRS